MDASGSCWLNFAHSKRSVSRMTAGPLASSACSARSRYSNGASDGRRGIPTAASVRSMRAYAAMIARRRSGSERRSSSDSSSASATSSCGRNRHGFGCFELRLANAATPAAASSAAMIATSSQRRRAPRVAEAGGCFPSAPAVPVFVWRAGCFAFSGACKWAWRRNQPTRKLVASMSRYCQRSNLGRCRPGVAGFDVSRLQRNTSATAMTKSATVVKT